VPEHRNGFSVTAIGPGMFVLAGELDMASRSLFESAIAASVPADGPVVLEVSGLKFMDSSGLAAVLSVFEAMTSGCLVLHGVHGPTQRLMEVTHIDGRERFHVIPCEEKLEAGDQAP
jgi:anti-anti-sigma factor